MPESEELKLSVSFVDNASAGLNKLRTDLDRLGGGDAANKVKKNLEEIGGGKHLEGFKKTGDHLENLRRQMVLFAEKGSGPLAEGLEKVSRMFLGVGRSGGIALGALGAVGGAMYAVQRTAVDFADKMEKLNEAARNTGLGMQQIKNLQNALRDSLIKPEEFDRYTNFVAKFSADIQKNSSQLTTYLRQVAGTNGAVMEQYIGHIRDLISKGLTGEAQTEILNLPIRMREEAIKSGKEITRATEEVKEAMRNMGFPESALRDFERVATASKTQEERLKGLSEETEKYNKKVADNSKLWGQVYDKLGEIAWAISKNPMNAMLDASKTLLEGMLHSFDAIEQKFKDFQHLKDTTGTAESKAEASPRKPEETPKQWLERTQTGGKSARQRLKESLDEQYKGMAPQQFASGGDITANLPESSNIEDRRGEGDTRGRLMGENTAELKKLNDYLTGQFARAAGGGVAGPAAVGLFSGGTVAAVGSARSWRRRRWRRSFRGLGGLPGFPGGGGGARRLGTGRSGRRGSDAEGRRATPTPTCQPAPPETAATTPKATPSLDHPGPVRGRRQSDDARRDEAASHSAIHQVTRHRCLDGDVRSVHVEGRQGARRHAAEKPRGRQQLEHVRRSGLFERSECDQRRRQAGRSHRRYRIARHRGGPDQRCVGQDYRVHRRRRQSGSGRRRGARGWSVRPRCHYEPQDRHWHRARPISNPALHPAAHRASQPHRDGKGDRHH